jgi:hypothetical protein
MNRFLTVVDATSCVVQKCSVVIFSLLWQSMPGGFEAKEERKNRMYSSWPPGHLFENVVICNATSCSANRWNKAPIWAGITSVIHLLASKGGSEQIIRYSHSNARVLKNYCSFSISWPNTCYVPRNGEISATQ